MKTNVLFVLVLAALLRACTCQSDGCEDVDEGLNPILGVCRESVRSCVQQDDQDLAQFSGFFCIDRAVNAFNSFLTCTNRTFSDQIFGAICGNFNCTRDEDPNVIFADCQQTEDRCFETVFDNDGTAAFEACMCSNESQSANSPTCSEECRMQLELLVSDVGCCVNTALYAYYFSTCGDLGVNPSLEILNTLYAACNVDLPATCLHPFSVTENPTEDAQVISSVLSILLFFTTLSFILSY